MSTTNFEFNGLTDSILPNVYINRIILEQLNSQLPSSNKYDMSPHINTSAQDGKNISAIPTGGYENVLKVTLDMFLEIPKIDDNDFWNMIFSEDLMNYLSVSTQFYSGKTGRTYYMMEMGQELPTGTPIPFNEMKGVTPPSFTKMDLGAHEALGHYGKEKQTAAKKKYKEFLPDGTAVFKIPIQVVTHISDAFPTDLAVIAYCTIDFDALIDEFGDLDVDLTGLTIPGTPSEHPRGRLASEVIIKDNKIQDKGMLFFISNEQYTTTTFDHLKGQIWLGDVHKSSKRYMAGKTHDSDVPHPYLDYVIVPNNRIQDFRQMATIQKQLFNFTPVTDLVFGGSYSKNIGTKALDNPAIFSNLISTTTQDGKVKLFFNIDWGKLIKKYCAVPALIDKLSSKSGLEEFLTSGAAATFFSFKVFREEIGVPHSVINQDNRNLIYDGYPKVFYQRKGDLLPLSSLVPVPLYIDEPYAGFVKSYSFTDYRKDPSAQQTKPGKAWTNSPRHISGKFKYSVEIVVHDPTVSYLIDQFQIAQTATNMLKDYTQLANGQGSETYWNSYLGKFNEKFKLKKLQWSPILAAVKVFSRMASLFRSDYVQSTEVDLAPGENADTNRWVEWGLAFHTMISPDTGSPDSIATVYEIFTTLTSQIKNVIESFSTATLPKESSGVDTAGNKILQQFTKTPVGASLPQRKIKVVHTFKDPADIVDTTMTAAGHDIFAHVQNISSYEIGLKVIHARGYVEESDREMAQLFNPDFPAAVPVLFEIDHTKLKDKNIAINANFATAKGHFFTVPEDTNPASHDLLHTVLPDAIVSRDDDEFSYAMLINNIIRYKFDLFGNPDKKSFLGYEFMNDPSSADLPTTIGHKMERIIKEYQSLAHQGAIFGHATSAWTGKLVPPSTGTATETETETGSPGDDTNKLPWAKDIKQERFLLALIMQDYFNLSFDNKSLAMFNTNKKHTIIGRYFNNLVAQIEVNPYGFGPITEAHAMKALQDDPGQSRAGYWSNKIKTLIKNGTRRSTQGLLPQNVSGPGNQVIPGLSALPNQIKALIFNNVAGAAPAVDASTQDKLNDRVRYVDDNEFNKLYKAKKMLTSQFGEFWFRHQNLIEVEYLSSFGKAEKIPVPPPVTIVDEEQGVLVAPGVPPPAASSALSPHRYEDVYNSSVASPNWKPLTAAKAASIGSTNKLLLCRLKKYRHPIFNQKAYNILDLPLYDEYFFLRFADPAEPALFKASTLNAVITQLGKEYIKLNSGI